VLLDYITKMGLLAGVCVTTIFLNVIEFPLLLKNEIKKPYIVWLFV